MSIRLGLRCTPESALEGFSSRVGAHVILIGIRGGGKEHFRELQVGDGNASNGEGGD
jgi:hypothetical protein